jgi:maltose O-acetyltransferase
MNTHATKLVRIVNEELYGLRMPLVIVKVLATMLPHYVGSRLRARILRLAGFQIGSGCMFLGMPTFIGGPGLEKRLKMGNNCILNVNCLFDLCGVVTFGSHVSLGPEVMFITGSHEMNSSGKRAGKVFPEPITVHDGTWLGARVVVLPGITIGAGSIVGAGAVVTRNVPPNTVVGGVPARIIRRMEP